MYFNTQFVSIRREIRYQYFKYLGYFTSFQRFVLSFIDLTHRYVVLSSHHLWAISRKPASYKYGKFDPNNKYKAKLTIKKKMVSKLE